MIHWARIKKKNHFFRETNFTKIFVKLISRKNSRKKEMKLYFFTENQIKHQKRDGEWQRYHNVEPQIFENAGECLI